VSAAGGWVRALAPAKVNLWLDVLARRADGFHELDTGLLALELADELEARVAPEPGVRLEVAGRFASADIPRDERNLAWRAAAACLEALGEDRGLELRLTKNVPSRAGLGAGSADAAAALLAGEAALGRSLDEGTVRTLLAGLGSDCVFFRAAAATGLARCSGRGEQVQALAAPPQGWSVVVLVPDVGAATAAVYAALPTPLSARPAASTVRHGLLHLEERAARGALSNGLEEAALSAVDGLAPWRALLDGCGAAHFRLSGSGSSFFGLFRDPDEAARCSTTLAHAARSRGLEPRAVLVTRPARRGARLEPSRPT
jgi:4-diphosphocytidyl-2-C-methyl-D-erythritol kinase